MLVMDAKISPTLQLISVRMQRPRLLVAFDFLLAVAEFFIPSVHTILSEGKGDENPLDMKGGIFLSEPAHKQAFKDVEISPSKPLVADCDTVNEYVYDGQGNHLRLLNRNGTDLSEFSPEALIFIGDGKRLIFRNIIIQVCLLLQFSVPEFYCSHYWGKKEKNMLVTVTYVTESHVAI
jgi:vacuolar protein sorting-associated protein 13A/C